MAAVLAMSVTQPDGPLVARTVEPTPPPSGSVRISVVASGVCFADIGTARAHGAHGPVTPGHEIAGRIAEIADGVGGWQVGDRVAVGWFGGSCGRCPACRSGDVVHCPDRRIPGQSYPGGWAQSVTVPADALARIPDGLDFFDAAPMGCAGVTTFNALRCAELDPGARVAVFGLGGLGHLAVQFAARMGHEVTVIARGPRRADLAHGLGATHYIDSTTTSPGAALRDAGGADLILSTASSTADAAELVAGLAVRGRLTLIGVDSGSLQIPVADLVLRSPVITGHLTGSPLDTEAAMRFALRTGVRPVLQRLPLTEAGTAVARLTAGQVRFRAVLDAADPERIDR